MAPRFLSINIPDASWVIRAVMKTLLATPAMPQFKLLVGWVWLCVAFVSGLVLGLFFHRENWLGGYSSFRRRMYRLAHISFFGLGIVNLAFYVTAKETSLSSPAMTIAGWSFVMGAISMPLCCLLMAHFPRMRLLFSVPVLSLLLGGTLVMAGLVHPRPPTSPQTFTSDTPAEWFPSNLDYIQSSNFLTRFRFNASSFNASTFRSP
jgi:hypothetical protein